MLRRGSHTIASASTRLAAACSVPALCSPARFLASEFKDIRLSNGGAAPPPSISHNEPVLPMDFNPHIEWFEYPKEIFDPKFPYTREESIRMTEESWESTMDEMASKYGMRLNMTTKPAFWLAWSLMFFYSWYTLWGCYRAMGTEPGWSHFKNVVLNQPTVPVLEEDEIYLDQWMRPEMREKFSRYDRFWNWKPLVNRDGAKTSWQIPMQYADESEWKHMTSRV